MSYPVIAGGRVFVTVENTQTYGTSLYALDAGTGATDWSVGLAGTYGFSALAYDGQVIFALNYDGVLTAFSASTGQELWATYMPDQWAFTAPPTAYDGVVYVSGAGTGATSTRSAKRTALSSGKAPWKTATRVRRPSMTAAFMSPTPASRTTGSA